MAEVTDIEAVAGVLSKRAALLDTLADESASQRDIRDELGVSRSTVYKSLRELELHDIVSETDGRYSLTVFGRLAWRRHTDSLARLSRLESARRLLAAAPGDEWLPLALFEHGQVVLPDRNDPERPLRRMETLAESASMLRGLSPAGFPRYLEGIHEEVRAGEQTVSLVIEAAAVRQLATGYEAFDEAISTDGLEIRVADDDLPFGILLFDDRCVGLFVYDAGTLVGAAFSEAPNALEWGHAVFETAVERSTPA